MKKLILLLPFLLTAVAAQAQDSTDVRTTPYVSLKFDLRFDGNYTHFDNSTTEASMEDIGGFIGKYFNIMLDGNITDKFSYSIRHRFNTKLDTNDIREFFSNTDWAYLTYKISPVLSVSAGKQVVLIGGYEYDRAPIDVYFWSDFWNNVTPYQIGVTFGFDTKDGKHGLKAQVTNSPFSVKALEGLMAYNLIWYGNFGVYRPIWSINMLEYEKGHFINYIALGNRFEFNRFSWEIDYMNRASAQQDNFFADFSIISRMDFKIGERLNIFAKGGYDQNKAQETGVPFVYDRYVVPGVEYWFCGAGVEFFPVARLGKNLRIHAFWHMNSNNPTPHSFNIGLRWQIKAFEF